MLLKDDGYVCKVDMNNIVHKCQQCGHQLNIFVHVHGSVSEGKIEKKVSERTQRGGEAASEPLGVPTQRNKFILTQEQIDNVFKTIDLGIVLQGQKGIARLVWKDLIPENTYIIKDKSRYNATYVNEDGNEVTDRGFTKLIEMIFMSVKKYVTEICLKNENIKNVLDLENDLCKSFNSILQMRNNPAPFCKELVQNL